jgi:hypothetical protein
MKNCRSGKKRTKQMLSGVWPQLSILFYSILFYSVLFYSILIYSVLFYSLLFYSVLFSSLLLYSVLFYCILFDSILLYYVILYLILPYFSLFYSILFYSVPYHTTVFCYTNVTMGNFVSLDLLGCSLFQGSKYIYSILAYLPKKNMMEKWKKNIMNECCRLS